MDNKTSQEKKEQDSSPGAPGNASTGSTTRPLSMASIAETEPITTADISRAQTPALGGATSGSVVTKPSFATLPGTDSTTDLLSASVPFAKSASKQPSLASLPESTGFSCPATQQQHRNISLKPSLASLPESPQGLIGGAALSPIASASPRRPNNAAQSPTATGTTPIPGLPKDPQAPPSKRVQYTKTLRNFFRIFSYSTRGDRIMIFAAVIAALGSGLTFPLMTIVIGQLIGSFASVTASWSDLPSQDALTDIINQTVLYMVYLFIGRFVLGYIATRVSLLDTHMSPGKVAAIMTTTANTLQIGISDKLAQILQAVSLAVSATVISFLHSWKLALVTCSGLVLITLCYVATIPFVVRNMRRVEESNVGASAVAAETFASIRMVAACGAEGRMERRYGRWVDDFQRKGMGLSKIVAVQQSTVHFSIFGILMCIMMITVTIGHLAAPISAAARAAGAASILFLGIDAPKPMVTGAKGRPDVNVEGNIALWNVNFTYPTRPTVKVLRGLNLIVPAGKVTAIVGPSGSGKSTIVGLIERWYELDGQRDDNKIVLFFRNGTITVGGKRLHEIDLKWWRSQIGLVQQEPFLFNDTIFNNVANGLIGTEWESAEHEKKRELVEQACKEAFADEFISRLPDGYDTSVGDSGIKLSGGQRQRLAIARSIVKKPKILILDEATSSLDVRGEKVVQAALDKVSKNRTTIMIAHRLSTVKKADNIVVLNKGRVVQWGTHDALMAQEGGPYWLLTNSQHLAMGDDNADDLGGDDLSSSEITENEKRTMDILTLDEGGAKAEPTGSTGSTEAGESKTSPKARGMVRSFGTMLMEQQRTLWPWYSVMLVGVVIAGACTPVQAYLFASLLSSFAFWGSFLIDLTNFFCLMFTMLAISAAVGYFALGFAATRVSFRITGAYRREYFKNIISKPTPFFDKDQHSTGGLTAALATDPAQLQQMLGTNTAFVGISALSVTGCLALAFTFGWKLTLVALSSSMPLTLAAAFLRVRAERGFERINLAVFAESAKFATESVGAIRTVSALTMEEGICGRYEDLLRGHVRRAFRRARVATLVFSASDSLPLLCMAFVLWYGGKLLVTGEYDTLSYLVVYIAVIQGALSAGQWLSFAPNIAQASGAANRIQDMRHQEEDQSQGIKLTSKDTESDQKGVKIELQDVWFRYPTRDVPVLCGLNMTIEKGQFAAIVGPSGSGKTSIISLLERFYKVKSGTIQFNGVDIQDINLPDYRRALSLVSQEPSLFEGTIRENVLLGVEQTQEEAEEADPSLSSSSLDELVHQACRDAEIHDFITSLPDGYSTRVGMRGMQLSGGQKQRIAIARALIRDPRLLLLDEATSSLDSETERQIQRVFERTRGGRSVVVVAHRLATVQNADIIFVLGDGRVLESGTHASLLQGKGVYYGMCQAQALDR